MQKEYTTASEAQAHRKQKHLECAGWTVSLVAFDPSRGVYAFDYTAETETETVRDPRLMDATVARNKLIRRGYTTTEVIHNETTGWYEFTYQAPVTN